MAVAKSGTLTPNQVTEITITVASSGSNNGLGVLNRSQTGAIWVRLDGVDPVIGGDDSFPVMNYRLFDAKAGYRSMTVKMIAEEAIDYTVEGTS